MNHFRVTRFRLRTPIRQMLRAAALLVLVLSTSVSLAQHTPDMVFEPAPGSTPAAASASANGIPQSSHSEAPGSDDLGVGGFGILGRVGHIAGETMERNQSITYFDLSPYVFAENTYLFGDGRLFLTNQGHMGGSAGLGMRQYFPRNDFVLGASGWYDRDDSRPASFQQLGLSLEMFSQWMDIRSNYYWGIGTTLQDLGTIVSPGSARFTDNQITFSTQTSLATSTNMVDLMFTVPITGEIAQSMNLEATAGWYHVYTPSVNFKNVNGYKLRLDGDFLDRVLHLYTELSVDPFYGTNLVAAADVNYWHHLEARPRLGASQYNRIAQWVRRNRGVITRDSVQINAPQAAINPSTGQPYFVNHVRHLVNPTLALPNFPAPTGTGALQSPFEYIPEAQTSGNADLIFVHADSVFDGRPPLVLNNGELVVGEGVTQSIPVQGGLLLPLPRATNGTNRPLIDNTVGTAVTLANNNLFAGFDINNTTGTAIFGSGVNSGSLSQLRIDGTTGGATAHGIHFQNATGQFQLRNVNISNTEGNAFYVDGGNAAIVYDSGTITNTNGTSGFAVLVENNSGGSVNMLGTTVNETGGDGVRVFNSGGATTLGTLNLTNTTGDAIHIEDVFGSVSIFGDVNIANPTGDGIFIRNLSGGVSGLSPIVINGRNGVGINLLDIASTGSVAFTGSVTMGAPGAGAGATDHGINFQRNAGQVAFNNITINGSNAAGINIGGVLADANTGSFLVAGQTTIIGDETTGITDSAIQLLNDGSAVTFNGITIGNRDDGGIEILNHSGNTNFAGLTTIRNELLDGTPALDIQLSTGNIVFGTVSALDTRGPNPGVNILSNTGPINFTSLSVDSTLTTALNIQTNSSVNIQGGTLIATGARAVTMIDNAAFGVVFNSVSSIGSDYGIFVDNNIALYDRPGSFTVLGDGQTPGTGGTITGKAISGASFTNVNNVDLGYMNILANTTGVDTTRVNGLTLFGDQVTGNGALGFGLDAFDTVDTLIQECLFDSNAGDSQVRIQASLVRNAGNVTTGLPGYRVVIRDNIFRDALALGAIGFDDMISISTLGSANGSALDLLVENNGRTNAGGVVGFTSNRRSGDAVIGTTWNGNVLAQYLNNNIRLSATFGQVGTRLVTTNATAATNVTYSGNVFHDGGGASDTGLLMDFAGSTSLSVLDNFGVDANGNPVVDGFTMNSPPAGPIGLVDDRAMDLTFRAGGNTVDISRNRIIYNSFENTAILFQTIGDASTVNMDGNRIVMFDDGLLAPELAILFAQVTGNITLSSAQNQDNVILPLLGTTIPLTIPPGTSTGGFLINGAFLDPP